MSRSNFFFFIIFNMPAKKKATRGTQALKKAQRRVHIETLKAKKAKIISELKKARRRR